MTEAATSKSVRRSARTPQVIPESDGSANAPTAHRKAKGRGPHKETLVKDRPASETTQPLLNKKKGTPADDTPTRKQPTRKLKETLVNESSAQAPRKTRSDSKKVQSSVEKDKGVMVQRDHNDQQPTRKPCQTCLAAAKKETNPTRAAQREETAKSHSRSNNKLCPAYKGRQSKQGKEQ